MKAVLHSDRYVGDLPPSRRNNAEKLEKDPFNRLISRGPRFRMDAEMVRDYALAASGLLVRKLGGAEREAVSTRRGLGSRCDDRQRHARLSRAIKARNCIAAACIPSGAQRPARLDGDIQRPHA